MDASYAESLSALVPWTRLKAIMVHLDAMPNMKTKLSHSWARSCKRCAHCLLQATSNFLKLLLFSKHRVTGYKISYLLQFRIFKLGGKEYLNGTDQT